MSLYSMLESVGTLKRATISRDLNKGVVQDPFTDIIVDVACSVQPASISAKEIYAQREAFITASIFFEDDIGARVNDRFHVVDSNGTEHIFLIHGFSQNLFSRYQSPYRLDCEELQ